MLLSLVSWSDSVKLLKKTMYPLFPIVSEAAIYCMVGSMKLSCLQID